MAKEILLVDDVQVELRRGKTKHSATLTREDTVKEIEASDRYKLLVAIGDLLADTYNVPLSYIWGLYNSVSLR